jgi:predicted glycosyltransferase
MLEDKIRKQILAGHRKALIVRGKPGASEIPNSGDLRTVSHLDSEALAQALRTAQFIVCRAGYSTLMDLHALGRSALIIPTPGQTEQEYLGQRCHAKGWHISMRQEQFDLESGIEALAKLPTCSFRPYQQTLPFLSPIFPSEKTRKENPKI